MNIIKDPDRRKVLAASAVVVASNLIPAQTQSATTSDSIRPFRINVTNAELTELRKRINATRWPERETVPDDSQGVPLAMMQELARYWGEDYDWRKCEDGFSGKPTATGWNPAHIARAWVVLMKRLGYSQFVSQGGDWGGAITNVMGEQAPPELLGIHVNFPATIPPDIAKALQCGDPVPSGLSDAERRAYEQLQVLYTKRRAYAQIMGTRPQTLCGLADSPVGLAAWLIDHGDGWAQPAAAITSAVLGRTVNGHPAGALTRDDVLDDITLYWLTNTAISSARLYWENKVGLYNAANISVPAAVSVFPGENYEAPRSWAERAYHKLIYYNSLDKGGHYAAWEQPQLFSEEVRAGFRPLRT